MGFTGIAFTDGTPFMAEGTQFYLTMAALGGVPFTDTMFTTGIAGNMIRAEALLTDRTGRTTGRAEALLAFGTSFDGQCPAMTTRAFDQAVVTIGRIVNRLVKAGADRPLASGTPDQTSLAEALAASTTGANFGAILVTPRAAQGAFATNINRRPGAHFYLINA